MKLFKRILASSLALLLSVTFLFGGFANTKINKTSIAYADQTRDAQKEQLELAINDATYVRSTQSYKNAEKKDIDIYEQSITYGQNLLNKTDASVDELYQATKNIDLNAKYLTKSANIVLIKLTIDKVEKKLIGIDFIEKNMPNSFKRYKSKIDIAKKNAVNAINKAKQFIKNNQR